MRIPCKPLALGQVWGSKNETKKKKKKDARKDPKFLLAFPTEPVWGGRGRRFWRGKELQEGWVPSGPCLELRVHISSLKFREEPQEKSFGKGTDFPPAGLCAQSPEHLQGAQSWELAASRLVMAALSPFPGHPWGDPGVFLSSGTDARCISGMTAQEIPCSEQIGSRETAPGQLESLREALEEWSGWD